MDISATVCPKSDQLNADDLIVSGPVTVTITAVSAGDNDQPVNIELAEYPGRAFRPCKTVRRILVAAWGKDSANYVGRRMTLFCDPNVKWGGQTVGGIRIKSMSHLDHKLTLSLTTTRGKRTPFTVEPLAELDEPPVDVTAISDDTAADFARDIAEATTLPELDQIAADLKTANLGTHRKQLLDAWTTRKNALTPGSYE